MERERGGDGREGGKDRENQKEKYRKRYLQRDENALMLYREKQTDKEESGIG